MTPDNVLLGDLSQFEPPVKSDDEVNQEVAELRKKAKYNRSKEFGELKEYMQQRIDFYQKYLPDGRAIATISQEDASRNWPIASIVIAELQLVIDSYQDAEEQFKNIADRLK